jgi:lipid II:glycine glycyltransferase (peptidoglycan interpeptide bridge formation enzyme)
MNNWELLTNETASRIWDENLARFADCSPFQSYAFGQYYQKLGWQACYWTATNEKGETVAMCLGLLRLFPLGFGMLWCVGGPVGDIKRWGESLRRTILETTGLKHLYLRFRCDRERNVADTLFLNHHGWARSIVPMTSSFSMELDLARGEETLFTNLDRRWRRNLRLAGQNNLVIKLCSNPDAEEISRVYGEMEMRKNLPQQFSSEKLKNLFTRAGSNLVFYRCEDESGNLISFRGCLTSGNRACDYLAATTEKGRGLRASYAVLWQLLRHCREQGIEIYDMGGIDPWGNPGVYTFKKETGAREVEFLGEWDWATSSSLRLLGNWAIGRRQNRKSAESTSVSSDKQRGRLANVFKFPSKKGYAPEQATP